MLSLYQFNQLCEEERIQVLEDFGTYLEVFRRAHGCKVALFSLYGFYVEVYLDEKKDRIIKTNAFNSYRRLDFYIRDIDIESLIPG